MPPKKRKAESVQEPDGEEWSGGELTDEEIIKASGNKFKVHLSHKPSRVDGASHLFGKFDHVDQHLKADHASRPLWVISGAGKIILESFNPLFAEAQDFLINIAEPVSRVSRIHEYALTTHSLFAAVSVGHTPEEIINRLERYSKTNLAPEMIKFIKKSALSYGKAKMVLKKTLTYIESDDPTLLRHLLTRRVMQDSLADSNASFVTEAAPKIGKMMIPGTKMAAGANQVAQPEAAAEESQAPDDMIAALREDDEEEEEAQVHSFQIRSEAREAVIKDCWDAGYPLTQEYDFNNDTDNPNLDIDLKPHAQIRYYQEKALSKMFSNSRARSGVIVLPCGAGKTLVGITAACGVRKSCIVLCNSTMSAIQWRAEFLKWSNINPEDIAVLTSSEKQVFPRSAGILVTTYHMLAASGKRAHDTERALKFIGEREWGLLIADEVHIIPAAMFKKVTHTVASHCKLGLTATLLREDDKIGTLNYLIGPKLYEANWQELSQQGHIAKVQCAEVWCRMAPEFYKEWLDTAGANSPKKQLLAVLNPYKFQACQFLIKYHASRGDKIIVFSDNVYALKKYALAIDQPFICGESTNSERIHILENFQHNPDVHTVFLSKIGDTSLDLPEATCLIQISSHYGSRRQEAQRLGRILRAKRRNDEGFNAFFYSLVSKDTDEMIYAARRQTFLVDQGYAFKIITKLEGIEQRDDLFFRTIEDRRELLTEVCLAKESDAAEEQIAGDSFSTNLHKKNKKATARRTAGTLADLSGGAGMSYMEFNKPATKKGKNDFLRKMNTSHTNKKKKAKNG